MQRPAGRGGEATHVGAGVARSVACLEAAVLADACETDGRKGGERGWHGSILSLLAQLPAVGRVIVAVRPGGTDAMSKTG